MSCNSCNSPSCKECTTIVVKETGLRGPRGPQGPAGPAGEPSTVEGPQGPIGLTGPAGANGADGADGADSTVVGPAGADGADGADGVDGLNLYQGIADPDNLFGVNDESYINSTSGDLFKKIGGVWTLTGNIYTGAIAGLSYLFNAKKTIEQYINITSNQSFFSEFTDDASAGRYDYGNSWLTDTWTAVGTLTNIAFGIVANFEVTGNESSGVGVLTLIVSLKKNGVAFSTATYNVGGKVIGQIININHITAATNFIDGDTVTVEVTKSIPGPNTFEAKMLTSSMLYNTQL